MTEQVLEQNDKLIVALDGDVDLNRVPDIRRILLDCVARGLDVLVDLSGVLH